MNTYKRHRFPPDIISYAVWLYFLFHLSHRDIEDLFAERGITVSREAIRLWCRKFGAIYTRLPEPAQLFRRHQQFVVPAPKSGLLPRGKLMNGSLPESLFNLGIRHVQVCLSEFLTRCSENFRIYVTCSQDLVT